MSLPSTACEVVATGLDHPECVAVGPDGVLYCGGEGGQIFRVDAGGGAAVEIANVGGECGGIALDGDGNLYECNMAKVVNRISPEGEVEVYSGGTAELPMTVPNYPVFDDAGNLFVSDSGDWELCNGRIYVVRPSGETELAFPDYLAFPNGMALDRERGWLYVAQSSVRNVVRLRLRDGKLEGRPEIYASLPAYAVPDGLALAAAGNLYVSYYEPSVILVVKPDRSFEVLIEGAVHGLFNRPTNVAFAPTPGTLYYANYGGHELGALPVAEPGMALAYPVLGRS
ncbi:MAG: NHL repeat-containing protein [Actinobacteria bacterium]|nr:NHL repeat-containing protein [Actinomycetota bacterium]